MFFELGFEAFIAFAQSGINLFWDKQKLKPNAQKLYDKSLSLSLDNPKLDLVFVFSKTGIEILRDPTFVADCSLYAQTQAVGKLLKKTQISDLINEKEIVLNGDLQILQHFSSLITDVKVDFRELLARYIGDIPAELIANFIDKLRGYLANIKEDEKLFITENLTTETKLLVHKYQADDFFVQVLALKSQVDRLEKDLISLKK